MTQFLTVFQLIIIAEEVTGIPSETLIHAAKLNLLESAAEAPRMQFDGLDPYPTVFDKAAVMGFQIARNHPLPDGNKRLAFMAMFEFCWINGYELEFDLDEGEETILKLASGELSREELATWLKKVARTITEES